MSLPNTQECKECAGTGVNPNAAHESCRDCDGKGRVPAVTDIVPGPYPGHEKGDEGSN